MIQSANDEISNITAIQFFRKVLNRLVAHVTDGRVSMNRSSPHFRDILATLFSDNQVMYSHYL